MTDLSFAARPTIFIGNYVFYNVKTIFQVEDTPLIEIIHKSNIGFTPRFSIFDVEGSDIARIEGTTILAVTKGKETGIAIIRQDNTWICKQSSQQTLFTVEQKENTLIITAELFTPAGTRTSIATGQELQFFDPDNKAIQISSGNATKSVHDAAIGLRLYGDGTLVLGQQ